MGDQLMNKKRTVTVFEIFRLAGLWSDDVSNRTLTVTAQDGTEITLSESDQAVLNWSYKPEDTN